jgi:hypothetical protein
MADGEAKSAEQHAQEHKEEQKKAADEMKEFEQRDEVPKDPSDWPSGKAKYITYGNESDEAYGEGNTAKLGPADVVHDDEGGVTVGGEKADPEDFKGEKIKGGVMEQIEDSKRSYQDESGGDGKEG